MKIEDLINRFEHYAKTLKSVRHDPDKRTERAFLHLDIEDLQESITSGLKFPAILVQTPEYGKGGENYDNLNEKINFTFLVLDSGSRKTKLQKISKSKKIADLLYARLLTDVNELEPLYGAIVGTDEGVFGPMGDIYGWGVSCDISTAFDGELKPEDWTNLEGEVAP